MLGSDKFQNLCKNLLKDFEKIWTFSKVKGMDTTNNLIERDLRKLVIWRKKSYGTRSFQKEKSLLKGLPL